MSPSWKKEMHVINYLRIIFLVNRIIVQSVWIFFFLFNRLIDEMKALTIEISIWRIDNNKEMKTAFLIRARFWSNFEAAVVLKFERGEVFFLHLE